MTLQEFQWIVQILVGIFGVAVLLIGAGKAWASVSQASAKLTAVHTRLDVFAKEQQWVKEQLIEIKTFLRVHPTLRFKIPDRPPPASSGDQDMFRDPGEGG